jgi:hypothetical protein
MIQNMLIDARISPSVFSADAFQLSWPAKVSLLDEMKAKRHPIFSEVCIETGAMQGAPMGAVACLCLRDFWNETDFSTIYFD